MVCRNSALVLMLSCVAAGAVRAQGPATPPLSFDAAVARALEANPTVVAAEMRAPIDRAAIAVARERPNPEARVELERETPTRAYSLAVPLEVGGQRGRRIAVGEAAARTGEAEVDRVRVDVRTAVRRAYFARVIADARHALFVDLRDLAMRARDAAQQRFDAGDAPRLEVLQAQLALAESTNAVTAADAVANATRTSLNALLAFPLDAATPLATPLDPGPVLAATDAVARALTGNADLAVLTRRMEEARARVALAHALQAPDVVSEATVTRGSEPEFSTGWRAAVAVTVPLFTRHKAGVAVEEATLAQVTAERDAARTLMAGDVTAAVAQADAQRQQYLRYRDEILPQATDIERLAEDAYRLGRTGISAYLQALQTTRDARLRSLQVASDFHQALADLEQAMGTPLP